MMAPDVNLPLHERGIQLARDVATAGRAEGGIPIGAALIASDGTLIAQGNNRRVQDGSPTRHAEVDCIENAGRFGLGALSAATLYTTLSPCFMCAGAIVHHRIGTVVIGDSETYEETETFLRSHGVAVVLLNDPGCRELMRRFAREHPELWAEDSGREVRVPDPLG